MQSSSEGSINRTRAYQGFDQAEGLQYQAELVPKGNQYGMQRSRFHYKGRRFPQFLIVNASSSEAWFQGLERGLAAPLK